MSLDEDRKKKRIHFILPGGGVNGAFQAGFLYRLMLDCAKYIDIDRIDGISVGALNGIAMLLEHPELIKNIWYSIEDRNNIFDSHSTNRAVWDKGSLYDSNGLREIVMTYKNYIIQTDLSKFNCVVHNSNKKCYEYINGLNENIWDYVIASASPPMLSPYSKIGENFYTDGGLDQVYPSDYITDDLSIIKLVVGYYNDTDYHLFNLYKYMKKSIDDNVKKISDLLKDDKIIAIINPCRNNIIDFRREIIEDAFKCGEESAVKFYTKYIVI
jgi:predicted patatin/cPLA2 family phospholipase